MPISLACRIEGAHGILAFSILRLDLQPDYTDHQAGVVLRHCQLVVGADFSTIASRMSKFLHFSKLPVSHGLDGSGIKGLYLLTEEIPMHRGSDSFINQNSVLSVEVAISHHAEVLVINMCARQLDYLANRWLSAAFLSTMVKVIFIESDTIDVLYIFGLF